MKGIILTGGSVTRLYPTRFYYLFSRHKYRSSVL